MIEGEIGTHLSDNHLIKFGVPQGSVFEPILFMIYTTPLSSIITKLSSVCHQLCTDITQIYLGISMQDATTSRKQLKLCFMDNQAWILQLLPIYILDNKTIPAV